MANRVVITGMGVVSPIGNDVETFWNSLKENKRGFGEITYFDTTDYKVKLAAQVKDFDPKQYICLLYTSWETFVIRSAFSRSLFTFSDRAISSPLLALLRFSAVSLIFPENCVKSTW